MHKAPAGGQEPGEARPCPPPWSSVHILESGYTVSVFDRLAVVKECRPRVTPPRPGLRGSVAGLSKSSRRRFLKLLAMIGRTDSCLFVTLTTHALRSEWEVSKDDFHKFRDNLQKQCPDVCGVWRFAWQSRGSAHYHLLLWGAGGCGNGDGDCEALLSRIWLKATGELSDAAARKHAVDVRQCFDFRGSGLYLALYQSDQASEHDEKESGRQWGVIRRDKLQLLPKLSYQLGDEQALFVRRTLRRLRARWAFSKHGVRLSKRGPLARSHGSFSSFLPVESAACLFGYVVKCVGIGLRSGATDFLAGPVGRLP